jgi:hypothetical protein
MCVSGFHFLTVAIPVTDALGGSHKTAPFPALCLDPKIILQMNDEIKMVLRTE